MSKKIVSLSNEEAKEIHIWVSMFLNEGPSYANGIFCFNITQKVTSKFVKDSVDEMQESGELLKLETLLKSFLSINDPIESTSLSNEESEKMFDLLNLILTDEAKETMNELRS